MPDEQSKRQDLPLARAEQGSETQAEQLVRDNIAWTLALAERMLCDRGLAEDAVQEAFMAAFRGLDRFEGRTTLKTWLHRITVNAPLTCLKGNPFGTAGLQQKNSSACQPRRAARKAALYYFV